MLKRRSAVSTRFVLTISVVYSVIIILIVLSFFYILKINSNILKEIVLKNNDSYFLKKASLAAEGISDDVKNLKELSKKLKKYCSRDSDYLYIIIFSKTADENYFRIQKKISLNPLIKIQAESNESVQERKEINYLKAGLLKPVIDPAVYFSNNIYYKTVYHPFKINSYDYVIEFIVSSSEVINTMNEYSEKINNIKRFSIIIAGCAVIIVIITTLLFNYNFSMLIKNLSGHLKKAAEGSLDAGLGPVKDDDLNELAYSFNGIFSELKLKKDFTGELFKQGVKFLKEQNISDAIAVFKTLTITRPNAFGSSFNLGVAYAKNKEFDLSINMFNKALEINPGHEITLDYITKVKRLQESQKKNAQSSPEIKK
ncbi:MAG: tetratricopeptide repeat protein [Spirochaetota bacterium]